VTVRLLDTRLVEIAALRFDYGDDGRRAAPVGAREPGVLREPGRPSTPFSPTNLPGPAVTAAGATPGAADATPAAAPTTPESHLWIG
jgi:hypothetical protein